MSISNPNHFKWLKYILTCSSNNNLGICGILISDVTVQIILFGQVDAAILKNKSTLEEGE